MTVTAQQIKDTFDEFDEVSDTLINIAIGQANRRVNKTQWGTTRFDDGVLWLSAHLLKAIISEDGLPAGAVTSERVAKVQASYQAVTIFANSALGATAYGRYFLDLESLVFPDRTT